MSIIETVNEALSNMKPGQHLSFKLVDGTIVPPAEREKYFDGEHKLIFCGIRHPDGPRLFSVTSSAGGYPMMVRLTDVDLESFKVHSRTVLVAMELYDDISNESLISRIENNSPCIGRVLDIASRDNL